MEKIPTMHIRNRSLRAWFLRKLNAVDRDDVQNFVNEFMVSNGKATIVVVHKEAKITNTEIKLPESGIAVAVAPWCWNLVVSQCKFICGPGQTPVIRGTLP